MILKEYRIILEGKSQLYEPIIQFKGRNIDIISFNDGTTWENKNVILAESENLEIYMSCKAQSGTCWKFIVHNNKTNAKIYETDGSTGEPLETRNGIRIANFSERKASIN